MPCGRQNALDKPRRSVVSTVVPYPAFATNCVSELEFQMARKQSALPGWIRRLLAVTVIVGWLPALAGTAHAAPVEATLAANGQALMPVVIAPGASELVHRAADDLADYLGRIAGARFTVVEGDGAHGIVVGVVSDFPALAAGAPFEPTDPFRREDYLLRSHARGISVLGASDRAAVHGVWDMLHRLGYRLFFLTDTWEVVPSQPDLHLTVDTFGKPDYITRQAPRGAPWTNRELWDRWLTRNRITSDFSLRTGHAYDGIIRANPDAFREHPEYFALVDGERRLAGRVDGRGNIKFCISNPGLRKLVVDHSVRLIQANPNLDSVSVDPSDGGNWCECEPCAKIGSVSDLAILLANDVAEAINALGLGPKYVGIYAYNQHSPPPSIDVHPKVVVSVATSFIRGGFAIEQLVEGWAARKAVLGVRDYHDVFTWSHDMPRRARGGNISYLTRTIPYFHEHGARFMNSENNDSWAANGLGYWLSPVMLWDVSAASRIDEYIDDFLDKAFAEAREPMRDFYHLINVDRSLRTPEDVTGRMYRALDAARKLARTPAVIARLDDLVLYTRYTELYHQYRAASGGQRQQLFEQIWRLAYRMRDRMMLSTVAICHRERYRDRAMNLPEGVTWSTPESEHPWKSSEPFGAPELAAMVAQGIENYPILVLDFEPVAYSDDLVPATALNLPEVPQGRLDLRGRSTRRFLTWFDSPGSITLQVTGGLIDHYRDRGNVRLSLYSPQEATLEPVAHDESVPPDGRTHKVTLRTPYQGLHTLQVADGSDMTNLVLPEGLPVTIQSSLENPPGRTLTGRWMLYFYVPRGTKIVGGFTTDRSGRLRDGDGDIAFNFADMDQAGYFSVPVPSGQDGRLWRIENVSGHKLLMTVPPYLARSEKELLLPREVVEADQHGRAAIPVP
jgi:hypothetical protein